MKSLDPHTIEFRNLKREIVFLPKGRVIEPRTSSYGICVVDNKVLLAQSAFSGLWEVPGGKSDSGEESLQTMRREFIEETGYEVPEQEFEYIGVNREYFYVDSTDAYCDSIMHFYIFHRLGRRLINKLDAHEITDVSWFDMNSIQKIQIHPISRKFLSLALQGWKL